MHLLKHKECRGLMSKCLIIIGGHEDKKNQLIILKEVARRIHYKKICIATVASEVEDSLYREYQRVFKKLGVKEVSHLKIKERREKFHSSNFKALENCEAVFFTGGDQLKITSKLGGTQICGIIQDVYANGGTIIGTSAGASVMSETMLIGGSNDSSYRIGGLQMAPGLGLIQNVVIDQHFAERGRIGRLLGAVAHNPKLLGIGIDENTSIIVENEKKFKVLGEGAVYVIDAHDSSGTNISDNSQNTLSIFNIKIHLLSSGDEFDLTNNQPTSGSVDMLKKR